MLSGYLLFWCLTTASAATRETQGSVTSSTIWIEWGVVPSPAGIDPPAATNMTDTTDITSHDSTITKTLVVGSFRSLVPAPFLNTTRPSAPVLTSTLSGTNTTAMAATSVMPGTSTNVATTGYWTSSPSRQPSIGIFTSAGAGADATYSNRALWSVLTLVSVFVNV